MVAAAGPSRVGGRPRRRRKVEAEEEARRERRARLLLNSDLPPEYDDLIMELRG